MHQQRTDVLRTGHPPTRRRVRGLGICDVLEVELEPEQIDGLIAEIDDLCIAHEQSISELASTRSHEAAACDEEVRRHLHQLAVARAIRGQLVSGEPGSRTVFGPARTLSELIDGATRSSAEALAQLVVDRPIAGTSATARAAELAATAETWAVTMVEVRELEWFVFEPDEGTGRPA